MIDFTPNLVVGVKKIDDQHKELFTRLNSVIGMGVKSASKEETQQTINLLSEYVLKHFSDEEALHRKAKYPKATEHRQLHQIYLNEIKGLKEEFQKNGPSVTFTLNLNNSIVKWIVSHIKNADMEFGKFYNKPV